MKRILISLLSLLFCLHLQAQEFWFEAGLKGNAGMSFLYNQNVLDDGNWDYKLSPMFGGGAKLSMNFGPYHGVFVEGLYNVSQQDWNYNVASSTEDFEYEAKWQSIDLLLLYRGIRNRTYFEIGPMYSMIQKVEQGSGGEKMETTDNYENSYFGGALGFGGYIAGAETASVGLGIRLHYGFNDIFIADGQNDIFLDPVADPGFESREKTNLMFVQFLVEFNFGIGRFAKTACSQRFKKIRRR